MRIAPVTLTNFTAKPEPKSEYAKMHAQLDAQAGFTQKYGGRLEEYELDKLKKTWTAPPTDSFVKATGVKTYNGRIVHRGKNCYRGATLVREWWELDKLKEAGVERVIDLEGYSDYERLCKNAGLKYCRFPVPDDGLFSNAAFMNKEDFLEHEARKMYVRRLSENERVEYSKLYDEKKEEFIEAFIGLVNVMKEGNFYIGCSLGTTKTNDVLCLNSLFNPEFGGFEWYGGSAILGPAKNLYNNLTEDHKKRLGWMPEWEQYVVEIIEGFEID